MSVEKIRIITINEDSLERCRPLCDALMQYQAEKSTLHTEVLAAMNFDNRLKASFLSTQNKTLIGAEYDGKIIGYAYATTHLMTTEGRYFLPDWLRPIYKEGQLVFYPDQQELPATIGVFNNLYVTPQFHGKGVGGKLAHQLMQWLYHSEASDCYVYISNGNETTMAPFYERLRFHYSHDMLDGFITAYHQKNKSD